VLQAMSGACGLCMLYNRLHLLTLQPCAKVCHQEVSGQEVVCLRM